MTTSLQGRILKCKQSSLRNSISNHGTQGERHTWVVFPQPVSPDSTTTSCSKTASITSCSIPRMGSSARAALHPRPSLHVHQPGPPRRLRGPPGPHQTSTAVRRISHGIRQPKLGSGSFHCLLEEGGVLRNRSLPVQNGGPLFMVVNILWM